MKKLLILLTVALVFGTGCQTDEGTEDVDEVIVDLTPAEAKAKLHTVIDEGGEDVIELIESKGVDGLADFASLFIDEDQFSGRTDHKRWINTKIQIISHYFVYGPAGRITEDDISFDEIKGVHDWNPTTEEFERTSDSDFFIVNFPSEGSTTNNATLSITDLQFITITEEDEFETYDTQLPTVIMATFKVDGATVITLNTSGSWTNSDFPDKAAIDLDVTPFAITANFDNSGSKTSKLSASVTKDDEVIVGSDVTLNFETSAKEEVVSASGFAQYRNVKIIGSIDVTYDDDTDDDINDFFDLEMSIDDQKVAIISFDDGDIALVEYSDGSTEILEEILEEVIQDIEDALEEFEGPDDEPDNGD